MEFVQILLMAVLLNNCVFNYNGITTSSGFASASTAVLAKPDNLLRTPKYAEYDPVRKLQLKDIALHHQHHEQEQQLQAQLQSQLQSQLQNQLPLQQQQPDQLQSSQVQPQLPVTLKQEPSLIDSDESVQADLDVSNEHDALDYEFGDAHLEGDDINSNTNNLNYDTAEFAMSDAELAAQAQMRAKEAVVLAEQVKSKDINYLLGLAPTNTGGDISGLELNPVKMDDNTNTKTNANALATAISDMKDSPPLERHARFQDGSPNGCNHHESNHDSQNRQMNEEQLKIIERITCLLKTMRHHAMGIIKVMNDLEVEFLGGDDEYDYGVDNSNGGLPPDMGTGCNPGTTNNMGSTNNMGPTNMGSTNMGTGCNTGATSMGSSPPMNTQCNHQGPDYHSKLPTPTAVSVKCYSHIGCNDNNNINNNNNDAILDSNTPSFADNNAYINPPDIEELSNRYASSKIAPIINEFGVPLSRHQPLLSNNEYAQQARSSVQSWREQIEDCKNILDSAVANAPQIRAAAVARNPRNKLRLNFAPDNSIIGRAINSISPLPYNNMRNGDGNCGHFNNNGQMAEQSYNPSVDVPGDVGNEYEYDNIKTASYDRKDTSSLAN